MEIPTEIRDEILSQLRASSTSFRDLRVAFTCKQLYDEFRPQIIAHQTDLLLDALDRNVLSFSPEKSAIGAAFRSMLQEEKLGGGRETIRGGLVLAVKSRHDIDVVWSVHGLLWRVQKLELPVVVDRLWLWLQSIHDHAWVWDPLKSLDEAIKEDAQRSLLHWGDSKDQHAVAYSLRALAVRAAEVVETGVEIHEEMKGRFEDLPASPDDLPSLSDLALEGTSGGKHSTRLTKISLTRVPTPRLFPFQSVDALVQGASASLTELHLSRCFLQEPSLEDAWRPVLDRWSFPRLSQLVFKDMAIPLQYLIGFFQRNPSITTATLELYCVPSAQGSTAGPTTQQCARRSGLQNLTATPEILLPLLQHDLCRAAFPNLNTLKIVQKRLAVSVHADFTYCNLHDVTTILSCVPAATPAVHTLSLDLAYPGQLDEWLACARGIDIPAPDDAALKGNLPSARSGSSSDIFCRHSVKSNAPLRPRSSLLSLSTTLGSLQQVTSLSFRVSHDPDHFGTGVTDMCFPPNVWLPPPLVVDFVGAFPKLGGVYLDGLFYEPWASKENRSSSGACVYRKEDFWSAVSRIWATRSGSTLQRLEISGVPDDRYRLEPAVWHRGNTGPG